MGAFEPLLNLAKALAPGYQGKWAAEQREGYVAVGVVNEDDEFCDFIEVTISDYSLDDEDDMKLAEFLCAANPVAVLALAERYAAVSGFARGALGYGEDDSKFDRMLKYGPKSAYLGGSLSRGCNYETLSENVRLKKELEALKQTALAQRLLLEQADEALTEDGTAYVELRAFLKGQMPAADVVDILGRESLSKR